MLRPLLLLTLAGCASSAATSAPPATSTTVTVSVAMRGGAPPMRPQRPTIVTMQPAQIAVVPQEPPRSERPPRPVTGIFAGQHHACALLDDRSVYCWGRNERGQCAQADRREVRCSSRDVACQAYEGDDGRTWRPARVEGLGDARSVALGESVSCALLEDGTVRCWGYHGAMRSGPDRQSDAQMREVRPVLGLSGVAHLSSGDRGSCAVADTGDVRCWNAGYLEPETVRQWRGVRQIFEGTYNLCAWTADGSLRCNDINQELTRGGVEHARFMASQPAGWAIKHSGREVCAWTTRGRVECGGNSGGYATGTVRLREVEGLRDVVQVSGGDHHFCARTRDGNVWCWGNNAAGQLGDGTTIERNVPVRVERLSGAVAIAAGGFFTCAIVQSGAVQCWGDNAWGQLGGTNRREHERTDPAPVMW